MKSLEHVPKLQLFPQHVRYLFLSHVKKVGEMVAKLGKVALVWDDMLRTVPLSDIKVNRIETYNPKKNS